MLADRILPGVLAFPASGGSAGARGAWESLASRAGPPERDLENPRPLGASVTWGCGAWVWGQIGRFVGINV